MLEQKLTTYFARYKSLTPRAEFLAQSKLRIAMSKQEQPAVRMTLRARLAQSLTLSGALALASVLLVVVLGGVSYLSKRTGGVATTAAVDAEAIALLHEASQLTSSVQIKEVDRFTQSSESVAVALDKLSKKTTPR